MTLVGNTFPRGLDLGTSELRSYREDTTGPPHSSSTEIGVPWCPCCAYGGIIGIVTEIVPAFASARVMTLNDSTMRWWSSRVTGAAKALAMPPPEKREELKKDVTFPHPILARNPRRPKASKWVTVNVIGSGSVCGFSLNKEYVCIYSLRIIKTIARSWIPYSVMMFGLAMQYLAAFTNSRDIKWNTTTETDDWLPWTLWKKPLKLKGDLLYSPNGLWVKESCRDLAFPSLGLNPKDPKSKFQKGSFAVWLVSACICPIHLPFNNSKIEGRAAQVQIPTACCDCPVWHVAPKSKVCHICSFIYGEFGSKSFKIMSSEDQKKTLKSSKSKTSGTNYRNKSWSIRYSGRKGSKRLLWNLGSKSFPIKKAKQLSSV